MSIIKRVLWAFRSGTQRDLQQFVGRMEDATAFGRQQTQASVQRRNQTRASRDFASTMAVPPAWRKPSENK